MTDIMLTCLCKKGCKGFIHKAVENSVEVVETLQIHTFSSKGEKGWLHELNKMLHNGCQRVTITKNSSA